MLTYQGSQSAETAANMLERSRNMALFEKLASKATGSIFADVHNTAVRNSLVDSERISKLLENASLTQNWEAAGNKAGAGHGKGDPIIVPFPSLGCWISSFHPYLFIVRLLLLPSSHHPHPPLSLSLSTTPSL